MIIGPDYWQSKNKELCCGCTACEMVCPVDAIQMKRDLEGFLYPVLDESVCIKCHRCEKVCPMMNNENMKEPLQVWAAVHKDEEVLRSSSSGGVFTALSDVILEENGSVAGAVIKDNNVVHCITEKKIEVARMRGSKYVQSELGDVFEELSNRLKAGQIVLFSGTPCQCAAARKMAGDSKKLFTVDFVCHGVPSPMVWRDYVQYRADIDGDMPKYLSLRAKLKHKMGYFETYTDSKQKVHHIPVYDSPYLTGFLSGILSRPSCYNCPYAEKKRASDITICDYWGYVQYHKEFDPQKGISAVLINTKQGTKLWERAAKKVYYHRSKLAQVALNNENLNHPTEKPEQRDCFFKERETESFSALVSKYLIDQKAIVKRIVANIPYPVKKILKKIRG